MVKLITSKYINNKLPPIFDICFATKGHLKIPTDTIATYGKRAFISMTTKTWNNIKSQFKDPMINAFSLNELKIFLFDFYLNLYQTEGFIACS